MITKFSRIIITILITVLGFGLLASVPNTYADGACGSDVPAEVRTAAGCEGNTDAIETIITGILFSIIGISGLIAVIFVVIGGINYMTSGGDTGKIEKAKKTLLYAVIGLAITVLAFAITNFVIRVLIGGKAK